MFSRWRSVTSTAPPIASAISGAGASRAARTAARTSTRPAASPATTGGSPRTPRRRRRSRSTAAIGDSADRDAQRRGDALAAAAAQEQREHVPDDRGGAGQRDRRRGQAEAAAQPDRHEALGGVGDQHGDRPALAHRARDVGRADVAAADLAQVDALRARQQQPERDRARHVRRRAKDVGVHDGAVFALSTGAAARVQNAATSSSDSVRGQSGGRLAISVAP